MPVADLDFRRGARIASNPQQREEIPCCLRLWVGHRALGVTISERISEERDR
jgi:hypothetical protein